jgi:hypothetical protein
MVQLNFDANQVAPNTGFEPVPEGWYNVAISESEMKPTKDGAGAMLVLKMSIIDGPHTGKPIFTRLNLQNANQQAVDIAYGELSAICHVTGVFQVADSSQLHGIPFQVKVNVRKGTDDKGNSFESNDVKGYKDAAGNEPGKPPQGNAAPANFGGTAAPAQAGGAAAFGGAPAQQDAPAQQPAQGGWGGQPLQATQPDPATQAAPAAQGGFDPNTGQPIQQAAPQGGGFDPNTGQPLQATQPDPAAQQPGNAGWTQPVQGGQPAQGGAPWGAQQGAQG